MEKLRGIVLDNDFLDITPKAVATKEKNRMWTTSNSETVPQNT